LRAVRPSFLRPRWFPRQARSTRRRERFVKVRDELSDGEVLLASGSIDISGGNAPLTEASAPYSADPQPPPRRGARWDCIKTSAPPEPPDHINAVSLRTSTVRPDARCPLIPVRTQSQLSVSNANDARVMSFNAAPPRQSFQRMGVLPLSPTRA